MILPHMEWMDKGYHILLVQAEENYYHALVSPDGVGYSIGKCPRGRDRHSRRAGAPYPGTG